MTDIELLEKLVVRDETALIQLQKKYGTYCQSIAMRILKDTQEAEEVVNDALLQVWERIPTAKPSNLKLYLAKTVRNTALHCIEFRNAQKRSGIHVQLDELAECIPGKLADCDAEIIVLRDALSSFLRGLKPEYRRMFVGRYWYGDSVHDLAQEFQCSENRVGVVLHRCRKQLKKYLEKEEIGL